MQIEQSKELLIEKTIPTTEAQKEIWLACEIGGEQANLSYNQSFTIDFTGSLQTDKLFEALKQLVIRHEALRSNFSINGQKSNIYIQPPIRVEKRDLSHLPSLLQEEQFGEFIREDALQSFHLENDLLFRFTLHIFNDQKHRVTLSLHHIVADGWSINIILKDLSKIYSELVQNKEIKLPPASQISEYVADEIDYKKSHAFQQTEEFWTSRFEKQPAPLNLPTDFPRKPERVYQSSRADFLIDQDLIDKIKQFSIKHQCSLPTILISTFKIFLYQISFQKNIILGLPTSGQVSQEKYNLVGHCANLLPLISELDPLKPFITHLKETRSNLFDAYEHQNFTFGELFKKILINRDHSRAVLVPVVLNIDTSLGDQVSFLGLNHKIISNPKSHEVFEIFLNINHTKAETVFEWTYNKELFKEESIRKYHESFVNILEKAIHNPECSIAEIVHKKQDNLVSKSIDKTLNELFYSAVEQFEQLPAVRFKNVQLTYNELNKFSNQFARYLLKKGIAPGDMVGISCSRSVDTVIALLGIIKARACYVPIDMSLPLERINYIVQNANIKSLFDEKWLNKHIVASNEFDANNLTLESDSHDLIYLLHTSGSTGVPKGVCMGDQALVNLLLWQINNSTMKAHSKTLQYSALSFDVSFQEIFATLLSGGELILVDEETRKDPKELLGYINQHGVNRLFMPFVALQSIADTAVNSCLFPSSLKEVITAGEQLKVTKQIRQLFSSLKHCTLSNQYGPTECHVVSQLKLEGSPETWPHLPSIGKEIYNTQIFILDNNLQEVLPGETGELCISGLPLAQGYLNQPEITSSKFITFVNEDGEHIRIYKTGDLAKRLPNGEIDFLGRQDFQVKIRGYRVELGEIEHHILAQKNIRDVVVTCMKSLSGNQQLTAYYILRDRNVGAIDIRQAIQQHLPEYMIPHHFIEVDQFPKTTSGKIDRKRLPSPQINTPKIKSNEDHPIDLVQEKVVNVWKHFLSNENVTVDSNFFEMGGHSLIAINVLIELEKQTGIRPKLSSIFKFPRLKDFALLYEKTLPKSDFEINQNNRQIISDETAAIIEAPILETQLEIWVTSILGGDLANKSYNISSAHILTGDLNIECLEKTIEAIVNRHESLRTRFNEDGSKMLIHKTVPVHIHQDDYSALDKFEQNQKILTYSREVSEAPFDLREENLFRFSLLKLSSNSYYFIFTVHHLICDGYSLNIILNEISAIYNLLLTDKPLSLPKAPSLLSYATHKDAFYKSDDYRKLITYWEHVIPKDLAPLDLPFDFPRKPSKSYKGASFQSNLSRASTKKIELFNKKHGSSFSLTTRILFELFIYQLSQQSNFMLGQLSSDQIHNASDGLVGHCVNLLPIHCSIDNQLSFLAHFKKRSADLIEAYSNQSITLGTLVKEINLKRAAHSPGSISVVFNSLIGLHSGLILNHVKAEEYHFDSQNEKFDLTLNVYGSEDLPLFEWNYSTDVFKEGTIRNFMLNFENLVDKLISTPAKTLDLLLIRNSDKELKYQFLSFFRRRS